MFSEVVLKSGCRITVKICMAFAKVPDLPMTHFHRRIDLKPRFNHPSLFMT